MRSPTVLVADRPGELLDQVRAVCERVRPAPAVIECEKLAQFDDVMSDLSDVDVVIAGQALANRSGLRRLARIHTQRPALSIILAFAERPSANLGDLVRTGAVDLLRLPVTDESLLATLERAIAMSRVEAADETAGATSARGSEQRTVIAVTSPTGGAGKTVFATNLAHFLRTSRGADTCLVDLDLEFGRVASALHLRPKYTIVDVLQRQEGQEQELAHHLDEYLVPSDAGVQVLAAPKESTEAELVGAVDAIRVLQTLRSHFEFVVIDVPASVNDVVLSTLDVADYVYVLSSLDLPSLRTLRRFVSMLEELKISIDAVRLVLNKEERDTGIDLEEVGKLFAREFTAVLPYDRDVTKSLNLGVPMLAYRPHAEFSRRMLAAVQELVSAGGEPLPEDGTAGSRSSGWRRLLRG